MAKLFEYRDYRLFLADSFKERKKAERSFTYRYIAKELGLKSAGHVTQILKGQAKISSKVLPKVIKLLALSKSDAHFFALLVEYGQCGNMVEKRDALQKMSRFSEGIAQILHEEQLEFYAHWYYAAIRDILALRPFRGEYRKLSRSLNPPISVQEAKEAIALLIKLDLIYRDSEGIYRATATILDIEKGEELQVILADYADKMIDRAKFALHYMDRSERNISWAGFSVSEETYTLIDDEIRIFRKRIMALVDEDKNPDRVYHMNIQCFPISKKVED